MHKSTFDNSTQEELYNHLSNQSNEFLLEQYAQERIAFEQDVKNRRYSAKREKMITVLQQVLLERLGQARSL